MDLLARVRRTIRRYALAAPDTRVAVAVSGGPDSVALAVLVRDLDAAGELHAAGIIHFNHQLRATADRDEEFTAKLAGSFGWPLVTERGDVAARGRRDQSSIEVAARAARHECFVRARARLGADVVALGHTRDDQAETFLLRLVRGAGPRGLSAMSPRNGFIVRPLLDCRRLDLIEFLAGRNLTYVVDETNADVSIPRNRVRAELLPLLTERFNPAVVDVLANEAALARELTEWLDDALRTFKVEPLGRSAARSDTIELDVVALKQAPAAVRRFAVWRATSAAPRLAGFDHIEAVLELLDREDDAGLDLPGQQVHRIGRRLVLTSRPPGWRNRTADKPEPFQYVLTVPGEVRLSEVGCIVSVEAASAAGGLNQPGNGQIGMVRRDLCVGPLVVRNRRPGDRFTPLGLRGRKKLQDFFVDRKVARHRRDQVPIVVDDRDRIVWVAGYAIEDEFRVTDPAQAVLILRLKPVGGSA